MPRIHARVALVAEQHTVIESMNVQYRSVRAQFIQCLVPSSRFQILFVALPRTAVASEVGHEGQHIRMTRRAKEPEKANRTRQRDVTDHF